MYEKEVRKLYNRRACSYDKAMHKARYTPTLEALLASLALETPEKVLDLGCGTGLATRVLLERFPYAEITGLDFSRKMLEIYQKKFPHARTLFGDFNQTQFSSFPERQAVKLEENSFDLVVSTGAVSEYGNVKKVIPFMYLVLRREGIFINVGVKKNIASIITGKIWHYKPTSRKRFIEICRKEGFSVVESIYLPWTLFPMNCLKYAVMARK